MHLFHHDFFAFLIKINTKYLRLQINSSIAIVKDIEDKNLANLLLDNKDELFRNNYLSNAYYINSKQFKS